MVDELPSTSVGSGADVAQSRTPPLLSPPDSEIPPTSTHKRHHEQQETGGRRINSEAVDPNALSKALERFESGRQRESTPGPSPSRKRQRMMYADRFIPNRSTQDLRESYSLLGSDGSPTTPSRSASRLSHGELNFQKIDEANRTYTNLLRSELFDSSAPPDATDRTYSPPSGAVMPPPSLTPSTPRKKFLSFTPSTSLSGHPTPIATPSSRRLNFNPHSALYSLSPIKKGSQEMLLTPRKTPRTVSKVPYKVLDAPDLADDFYLNLVDWGSQNILGVGLGTCVYMWNSNSGRVTRLCQLEDDTVTSVNWIQRGSHIAIGTGKGLVQIWDATCTRRLRTMTGHTNRVGALAWNEHILTSGARDRLIFHRDVRMPDQYLRKLVGHKQEICGLKWNTEDGQLASGGNDNKLMVWDKLGAEPMYKFSEHCAAVKAIAWSPHQRGLLASGGGTADRTIKFWNTLTSSQAPTNAAVTAATLAHDPDAVIPSPNLLSSLDTGSQVCNLAWSKNSNELVSTHGYSQNQIVVWKYPSMQQVVSLTGHTYRVLYLAMSPNGQTIVTGAGDETLRFWDAFRKKEPQTGLGREDGWGTIR